MVIYTGKKIQKRGNMDKNPHASTGDMGLIPVQEGSICHGVTKARHQNYQAYTSQLLKTLHPRACVLQQEKPSQ